MSEPKYRFQERVTPWKSFFAWRPVCLWDGRWTWFRKVYRAVYQTKDYLSGPILTELVYIDYAPWRQNT